MQTEGKDQGSAAESTGINPFEIRTADLALGPATAGVHVYQKKGFVCDTDSLGQATPGGRSITEIVVDASNGFIPLWSKGVTLQWRFREQSLAVFRNPVAAKAAIRQLLGGAILAWGDAAPVKFSENADVWDFEIVMKPSDNCTDRGCVLASAFFPDGGRHQFYVYPRMFVQSREEQVDTLTHEIGHVFGLRHFFANLETGFPSQIFGVHQKFTIMNYGEFSQLTADDRADLKRLYDLAWRGDLTQINGTPIRFMKPFHAAAAPLQAVSAAELTPGPGGPSNRVEAARQLLQVSADLLAGKLTG